MQTYPCPLCRTDIKMAREPGNFIYISHTQVDEYAKDLGILKDAERCAYNRFRLQYDSAK